MFCRERDHHSLMMINAAVQQRNRICFIIRNDVTLVEIQKLILNPENFQRLTVCLLLIKPCTYRVVCNVMLRQSDLHCTCQSFDSKPAKLTP